MVGIESQVALILLEAFSGKDPHHRGNIEIVIILNELQIDSRSVFEGLTDKN